MKRTLWLLPVLILGVLLPGQVAESGGRGKVLAGSAVASTPNAPRSGAGQTPNLTRELAEDAVRRAVETFVRNQVPWETDQVEVGRVSFPGPVTLPEGDVSFQVSSPRNSKLLGKVTLSVFVSVNRRPVRTIWVSAEITVWADAVIALRPLYKGEKVRPDDVTVDRRRMQDLPAGSLSSPDEAVGKKVTRLVAAGSVVTGSALQDPPVIKRGEWVTIIAEGKNIRVTAPGEAREDGAPGTSIRVTNRMSKRTLQAKVLEAGIVRVEY